MNRLHPQDLRAILAALAYMDPEANPKIARCRADFLLAELESTAKPEAPVPDAGIPPMPNIMDYESPHNYRDVLEAWGRDLAARLTASNALCAELAEALEKCDLASCRGSYKDIQSIATAAIAKFKEATR